MTALAQPQLPRMTADEFIAWSMEHGNGGKYELVGGEVLAMAPERAGHWRVKTHVARALTDAIEHGGLACEVLGDRMAVEVSADTVYEPDAMVRCGPPVPDDAVRVLDPVVIVEVLSPSPRAQDSGAKLGDYFLLPTLRHYLLVDSVRRAVIHHARAADGGEITTRIARDGAVRLDPPGIALDVAGLFQALRGKAPR